MRATSCCVRHNTTLYYNDNYIILSLIVIAMLIGVHFLPSMTKDKDGAKSVLILMSALAGYVVLLLAIYNIYPIRYHKSKPA